MDNLLILPSKYKKKSLSKEDELVKKLTEEIKRQNVTRIGESLSPGEFAASTQGPLFDEYDMY